MNKSSNFGNRIVRNLKIFEGQLEFYIPNWSKFKLSGHQNLEAPSFEETGCQGSPNSSCLKHPSLQITSAAVAVSGTALSLQLIASRIFGAAVSLNWNHISELQL